MKKLLGISLVAVLAATPLMAFAAAGDIDKDPGATVSENAPVATNSPKYGLATSDATDANAASAGYVKGAYNAAIRAINSVDGRIDTINTNKANKDFSNVAAGAIAKEKLASDVQTSLGLADSALQSGDKVSELTNDAGYITKDVNDLTNYTKTTDLATVATTGAAADLSQDATHRLVSDTEKATWNAALQSGDNVSKLNNDAGYITSAALDGYATEDGVENTVKNTINAVTLTQGTVTNGALTGDLATTTDTITVMTEWGSTQSKTDKTFVASASKGDLGTNVSVTAPTINTVSTVTYSEPQG